MSEIDELSWLAYRYVTNELELSLQASFEARLESDQAAREAVARAQELADCLVAAGHADRSAAVHLRDAKAFRSSWQGVMGAALGAAIVLMLVAGGFALFGPDRADPTSIADPMNSEPVSPETVSLATIWSEIRTPLDEPAWTDSDWEGTESLALDEAEMSSDDEPSGWIQAAVCGLADKDAPGSTSDLGGTL